MIAEERKLHFSYEESEKLTDIERTADANLTKLRKQLATPLYNVVLQNFYKVKPVIEAHKLYQVLDSMPKGALHHIHTTASPHVEEYIKLTYDPVVAYNEREGLFKVLLGKEQLDGYIRCVEVRNFWKDAHLYDDHLRKQILLTEVETEKLESHDVWTKFQPKFARVGDLCKYVKFFKQLLKSTLTACA
jgi:adenosine deaminase CECR1